MKRLLWLGSSMLVISIAGCGRNVQSMTSNSYFAPLPSDPSSIVVTKYVDSHSKKTDVSSYTLTGTKMAVLYNAIKDDAQHVLPKNWSASCPSYTTGTVVWDYQIVIHYPDYPNRSFTQSTEGCTILNDDQTGAMAFTRRLNGYLPGLDPLTTGSSQ